MSAPRPIRTRSEAGPELARNETGTSRDRAAGDRADHDRALARCAVYVAFALGFAPPDRSAARERLATGAGHRALAGALAAAGSPGLAALVEDLERPEVATFRRLFGHTARGAVPPYESEYGDDDLFQQPQRLADVAGFLAAFGLRLDPERHERVDHVRCELEFLAFLARREADALGAGDADALDVVRGAQALFLRDHLGRFAPALGARLEREDEAFYGALGRLLRRFVAAECRRLGVAAGPEDLLLRPDAEDRLPMACGGGAEATAELVQLGRGGGSAR